MAVGKTTLFEAISDALYGLKIESKEHFMELLNQGAINTQKPEITLEITFVGKVLGQQQKYKLKRFYVLNPAGRPLESVSLNMNGNMYVHGTMTPANVAFHGKKLVISTLVYIALGQIPTAVRFLKPADALQSVTGLLSCPACCITDKKTPTISPVYDKNGLVCFLVSEYLFLYRGTLILNPRLSIYL